MFKNFITLCNSAIKNPGGFLLILSHHFSPQFLVFDIYLSNIPTQLIHYPYAKMLVNKTNLLLEQKL
jgi:hypothetical protein